MAKLKNTPGDPKVVPTADWRTSDADELAKRRQRARDEVFQITNRDARHPIFSNFRVKSGSGLTYSVEIRGVAERQFACDCVDFRSNGLGTCKHVEAVLLLVEARFKRLFKAAVAQGSNRLDVVVDVAANTIRVNGPAKNLPRTVRDWFDETGRLVHESPDTAVAALAKLAESDGSLLRVSQEVGPWLEEGRRAIERRELRHQYELNVQSGVWPAHETRVPLFPYQREGMLHLAFTERALLADEMGLGKTIQAIAACALLHRLGLARRVLVVTPASLKTEWEEQIRRFTELPYQIVYGSRRQRLEAYLRCSPQETRPATLTRPPGTLSHRMGEGRGKGELVVQPGDSSIEPPFFTIVNYEQMVGDALDVNQHHRPDVVVLDEAQRIKNWSTKTAQAVKRLRSRYAFVLTGTPIENRIDELHSLMDFLNPTVLGPLFRFNRDFYELDERGRPIGVRNLDQLHKRIQPYLLRRRKADVETELPARTDRNHFVPLSPIQRERYQEHADQVARLANIAKRRPLTKQEQEKLQRELAMMRMICDTNYILDAEDRTCPKLAELEKLIEECVANDAKVIVFSEWARMLELVRDHCQERQIGYAWHTGSVPQKRRRAEINAFKSDPNCRVFLSTDSGATGLNLQVASVVINCDLPWNPAKLEQRIARAWRKHQTRPVSVFNLVSEATIEHRMLDTLVTKSTVADSVLDHPGRVTSIKLSSGRQAFAERLQQLMSVSPTRPAQAAPMASRALPADPALAFAQLARERINGAIVTCEERYPQDRPHSVLVVVVDGDAGRWQENLKSLHAELFGPGKTDPLAPTQLEVIDRATHEVIERLVSAGLLARATRAARPLLPTGEGETPAPLSAEEQARAKSHREKAKHHLRLARVLGPAGFEQETRSNLQESTLALGRALAVESRLPEPAAMAEVVAPPLSHAWKESLAEVTAFVSNETADWKPIAARFQAALEV